MTPVNWLAHNLIQISDIQNQSGHVYNMTQTKTISAEQLAALTQDMGYNIQLCAYETWHKSLTNSQLAHLLEAFGDELLTPCGELVQSNFQRMQKRLNLTHEIDVAAITHCLQVCHNNKQEDLTHA